MLFCASVSRGNPVNDKPFSSENAPRNIPLNYPGVWPEFSCLITGSDVFRLSAPGETPELGLRKRFPYNLRNAEVVFDTRSNGSLSMLPNFSSGRSMPLWKFLQQSDEDAIEKRIPVLAIGSNAAPSQLRHKYQQNPLMIPSIRARVYGVKVGFVPQLVGRGYMPATLVRGVKGKAIDSREKPNREGESADLFVQFLTQDDLELLDSTEEGYRRVWFQASTKDDKGKTHWNDIFAELENGEILSGFFAYIADDGHMTFGSSVALMELPDRVVNTSIAQDALSFMSQEDLLVHAIKSFAGISTSDQSIIEIVDGGPEAHARFNARIIESTRIHASREWVQSLIPGASGSPYLGRQETSWSPTDDTRVGFVANTPEEITWKHRKGEPVVALPLGIFEGLNKPELIEIRSELHASRPGTEYLRAVARAVPYVHIRVPEKGKPPKRSVLSVEESIKNVRKFGGVAVSLMPEEAQLLDGVGDPEQDRDIFLVDEVLRWSIGVSPIPQEFFRTEPLGGDFIGEKVEVRAIKRSDAESRLSKMFARFRLRPNYITMRVEMADPTTIERDVALMSGLSLSVLGIPDGGWAYIEGLPSTEGAGSGVLAARRMRAMNADGFAGGFDADPHDLPRISIDFSNREALNVKVNSTVRVRVALSSLFWREVSDLGIVLGVAGISIVMSFSPTQGDDSVVFRLAVSGVLVVAVAGIAYVRAIGKFSHKIKGKERRQNR
jgi:hypothetical protein